MSDFDKKRALREEIAGINEVVGAMGVVERRAEEAIGRAESELNAVRKLVGFAKIIREDKMSEMARIEAEEKAALP